MRSLKTSIGPARLAVPHPNLVRGLLVGLVADSIGAPRTVFARWGIARGTDAVDMTLLRFALPGW
jgi:hypothetical protein